MAIFNMIEESEAKGRVKEIFEDIKQKRNIKSVNNFWKMLANEPETLERTWSSLQQVMKKGALDEMTKELIYIAVSITNSCEYCIKSHSSAAIKKGASKDMLAELIAVVGMANETNKLVESYQVKVDEIYE
ncbi:carboxymuconolactone decarboxylase family protein [Candidatus Pelagibacter sp.]|nr:carboxymuconolactone decarboxylase family protein [Candidatus Pelagibacter sp.]